VFGSESDARPSHVAALATETIGPNTIDRNLESIVLM